MKAYSVEHHNVEHHNKAGLAMNPRNAFLVLVAEMCESRAERGG